MNILEKALLIKELNVLLDGLEHRSLSFYEIAYSKSRLNDIFTLCDNPAFKEQILRFKSRTQPEQTAYTFADYIGYGQSFRGVFLQEDSLEHALYQQPEMGWAMLYQPQAGWQIWFIPMPHRTALISQWADLATLYSWLIEHQQHYQSLKLDVVFQQDAQANAVMVQEQVADLINVSPSRLESTPSKEIPRPLSEPNEASQSFASYESLNAYLEPSIQAEDISSSSLSTESFEDEATQAVLHQQKAIDGESTTQLVLGSNATVLHAFKQNHLASLYKIEIPSQTQILDYATLLFYDSTLDWQQHPVFIAEQVQNNRQFSQYVLLLGAENQIQAIRLMSNFSDLQQSSIVAVKQSSWQTLQNDFMQFDLLFNHYTENAELLWKIENYFPFVPAQLLQTHKFIQFEENTATIQTPLLLLKDRQKLRLIHGQNRLNLNLDESAYPYLLLDRQHGISWQLIQSALNELNTPVLCAELYASIQKHISQ